MEKSPSEKRSDTLREFVNGLDLLVIGGGINGAGVFRDGAMRGLKTGLIEKSDFASGTSSRSSKLIHGGVRYLEHMEFGLVMESSIERTTLLRLLPDLVQPAPFILPVYKGDRHGLSVMDLGLWLYDALSFFRNFKLHKRLNKNETLNHLPTLKPDGLTGSVLYYDARVNDARLTLNNITSGTRHGGMALNHARAIKIEKHPTSAGFDVWVQDELTREVHHVPCKALVCAVGPWTNRFFRVLEGFEKKVLRLTKGIHLLFPKKKFKTETAVVITSNDDRRIIFVIPWEEYTLVGTTDTDFEEDLDHVVATPEDARYLLERVNGFFPTLNLKASDAISAFAGLRPLLLANGSASTVSRKDKILKTKAGAFVIGGGKLTTYRRISEKTLNRVIKTLPFELQARLKSCATHLEPLVERPCTANIVPVSADILDYLTQRYGTGAESILRLIQEDFTLGDRIDSSLPFVFAEIPYTASEEMLLTVTDFFRLRTEIYLKAHDNGLSKTERAATLLGKALSLSPEAIKKQVQDYSDFVAQNKNCLQ